MAAVERRDPVLIAARALKTTRRAMWVAHMNGDQELADDLELVAGELRRIVGDTAVVRISSSPSHGRCA